MPIAEYRADQPSAPPRGSFASAWRRAHLSVAERNARGRNARRGAPRSAHARWEPAWDRQDPVQLLEEQARTRVPELVPIRHGRMLESPFAFFRGGAQIMAGDLAGSATSGITVQLCGDAHLSNFGAFASPERRLVFDINDFDETLPGPFEHDLLRLVASLAVAGRNNSFDGSNIARITESGSVEKLASTARLVPETSSLMPTVKPCLGVAPARLSNTALTIAGVNSFEDKP